MMSSDTTSSYFLFYLVFYGFLAGMFTLTMWVMLQTLDDYTPKYRDRVADPEYNESAQDKNEQCPEGVYFEQDGVQEKKVCRFKRSLLRQCSGLADSMFGYSEGQPCILVKMNRVIGLRPRGDPHIICGAKRELPLQMQYFPSEGRLDKTRICPPVVAVKLLLAEEDYNSELVIECQVEGSDLRTTMTVTSS
ncbi:Sodium/potassium-transporting ATPase subunit beta-3 [Triplophysa tibetana]|uniref:Sodium/potassium-transporting ATPase subunit beta-3 n=1 Tax=Triplophysa tibetana TaxID=1572043 RepID=A0A5A9MZ45_9TELE|nr:Sodium/potassium-transporting ATPase subunit beta-3 [Triplophysa tibetana]